MLGTFITISSEDITAMIGYASGLLTDLQPLLIIIVGIAVGLIIFWAIMKAIKS